MTNQVTLVENKSIQIFDQEKVDLIKKTVAQGATDLELKLFLEQCKRTGLDPITRQIYFIKNDGKVQVQTSIDGFRLVAERSGQYEGQTSPVWCGADGVWKDVWLSKTPPSACKIGVYKRGFREALYAIALFDEYAQKKRDGSLSFMWGKMPALMIAKVAESLALRKAFPNDLSGIYTSEEMAQSQVEGESKSVTVHQEQATSQSRQSSAPSFATNPPVNDGADDFPFETPRQSVEPTHSFAPELVNEVDEYVIPFGQFTGKRFSEVDGVKLKGYYGYCRDNATAQAEKEGRPVRKQMAEFLEKAESYLRSSGFLSHS